MSGLAIAEAPRVAFQGNWSFSKLDVYETCAYRFKLQYLDKLPQLPVKPDNPMERGNRIHNRLEKFVKGEGDMDTEARAIDKFVPQLEHLRDLYADGKATAEQNWWFDIDWGVCRREDVWLWSKLDFNVTDQDNALSVVGDYKSGKSAYKAYSHVQQMQLYAAATALRQTWANTIIVELWYVDEGHIKTSKYTREDALRFVGRFDPRAKRLYDDHMYRPNPTKDSCRYCPYGKANGTGACPVSA